MNERDDTAEVASDDISTTTLRDRASRHQLGLMLAATVVIAVLFTVVSVAFYIRSGAAQLDLSRPGYDGVRDTARTDKSSLQEFSASGQIDERSLHEFERLYDIQQQENQDIDPFNGDPMALDALGIDERPVDESSH